MRRVIVLGSTGSIGTQTLEVLRALVDQGEPWRIVGLAAGANHALLFEQAQQWGVTELAARADSQDTPQGVRLRTGVDAAQRLVEEVECDLIVAAIVGSAGLKATLAGVDLGRDIALANKETLVAAGSIVVERAAKSGARLLPVDSEHAGVWQCLHSSADGFIAPPFTASSDIERVTLTASGGALRDWPLERIENATPEQALAHPNWSMGAKVTIDCASLTNKALELVEARWLFGLTSDRLAAVIHPQSIIHAMVSYRDGSLIAQLGEPDMRCPIQYALTAPRRPKGITQAADLAQIGSLTFAEPDHERFPALGLGFRVIDEGGTSGAVFNAANEAAVEAFLAGRIPFGRIARLTAAAMDALPPSPVRDLEDALAADAEARRYVDRALSQSPITR